MKQVTYSELEYKTIYSNIKKISHLHSYHKHLA